MGRDNVAYNSYRNETRHQDSVLYTFTWGNVLVSDTLGHSTDKAVLHFGVDTSGSSGADAVRDSLFKTEWFVIPYGSEVTYDRLITVNIHWDPFGGNVDDPAPYNPCDPPNPPLATGSTVRYDVEMVHRSGHIDTVETMFYDMYPTGTRRITPKRIHITNSRSLLDTVELRIKGSISGFSSVDSTYEFSAQADFGDAMVSVDSSIAMKPADATAGPDSKPVLYPNPVSAGKPLIINSASLGRAWKIEIVDQLGKTIVLTDAPGSDVSTLIAPSVAGVYYMRLFTGNAIMSIPFVVH